MKKCPTCEKTFDNSLRFCQTDGTPLVEITDDTPDDPYKTTVGRQGVFAPETPPDPFKTMIGGSFKKEDADNLLQLPDENQDPLKTMFISDEEMKKQLAGNEPEKEKIIEIPPLDNYSASSAEKKDSSYTVPPPPTFDKPNFGDLPSGSPSAGSTPFEKPSENMSSSFSGSDSKDVLSPFDQKAADDAPINPFDSAPPFKQPNAPIPSPFDDTKPTSYNPPSAPLPTYKEPESLNVEQNNPFSQPPFGQSSMPVSEPLQQTEWTPPPLPDSNWQNQEIGANTPFQPPGAAGGQNQTLAIVSLILGILSVLCCAWFLPGIIAVVLGFMAKSKAEQNPNEYGGRGLALGGIITGGISVVLGIIVMILYLFTGMLAGIGNL
ncbi:MAG: DUF4190 domain-containing protein [Acidobacteriota bacterium]|nr:DUF4190 domain-containing protein [Acidobacteriota bacterium]